MSYSRKTRFEQAVKWGDDEAIRETAKELFNSAFCGHKEETAEFIAKTLRKNKSWETQRSGSVTQYDGIKVRTGSFPHLEVEDPLPPYHEEPPLTPRHRHYEYEEDEEVNWDEDDQREEAGDSR
jgi:hypothetical protein